MKKKKPHYHFLIATFDYGKNLNSYFIGNEFAVYYSRLGEGPNERVMLAEVEEHEIAQKIVWMIESSNSW